MSICANRLEKIKQRFERYVERDEDGCAIWTGGRSFGGYGKAFKARGGPYGSFYVDRDHKTVRAHVFAAYAAGKIPTIRVPDGHHLDHTCEKTLCVNCTELVPSEVNLKRRWGR